MTKNTMLLSIKEYRELLKDEISSDEKILERIQYLEAFCRNIIRPELKNYSEKEKYERRKKI